VHGRGRHGAPPGISIDFEQEQPGSATGPLLTPHPKQLRGDGEVPPPPAHAPRGEERGQWQSAQHHLHHAPSGPHGVDLSAADFICECGNYERRGERLIRICRHCNTHVKKILIKLIKMQLSLKARENQVVKVSNQNLNYQDFKFEVSKCCLVWTDILNPQIFRIYQS
jgi:hypothetical protein